MMLLWKVTKLLRFLYMFIGAHMCSFGHISSSGVEDHRVSMYST